MLYKSYETIFYHECNRGIQTTANWNLHYRLYRVYNIMSSNGIIDLAKHLKPRCGLVFCLLLGVISSGYAQPITGQVTEVTCPVIGQAQPELTPNRKRAVVRWLVYIPITLLWRHNGRDGISNHQPCDCLHNRLFRCRSKKHQSSASLALCGKFTGDRWIPDRKGQ